MATAEERLKGLIGELHFQLIVALAQLEDAQKRLEEKNNGSTEL